MTATATKLATHKPMQVHIDGKIDRKRRYDNKTYTTVITPAADEYSRPNVIEIRSSQNVGEIDEKISVDCVLGGYLGKSYSVTDRSTGELRQIVPVNLFLDLIE